MIYSYDIFDTIITRVHAYPRDLFLELGYQFAPNHFSPLKKRRFAKSFQRRRIWAEKIAYLKAHPHRSASLSEIYRNFLTPRTLKINKDRIIARELELENKSTYPIPQTISEINYRIANGQRVIFVSDMYLSRVELCAMLRKHGLQELGANIYVSSDCIATKHSGDLFVQVLTSESVSSDQIIHTGDNCWADITVPRRLGITSLHFSAAWLTEHEVKIAGDSSKRDIGKSYLAGLSRKLRLTCARASNAPFLPDEVEHFMFGTIAPFLVSFVNWILKDASNTGVNRLYFVARDGEILYKIAKRLLGDRSNIELRYLYGSRRSWLVPSITKRSEAWRKLLVTSGQTNTARDILERAGIQDRLLDEMRSVLNLSSEDLEIELSSDHANLFVDEIFTNSVASKLIFDNAATIRAITLKYFEQEGLFENTNWALVDIGWSLNCQAAIKRILNTALGDKFEPTGYYLGLGRNHLNESEAGKYRCYINTPGSLFSRRRVILEHCFTPSTHATTKSYKLELDRRASPEFGEDVRSNMELIYAKRLHEIAEHTAELFANDEQVGHSICSYMDHINANVERLIRFPSKSEATSIAHFGAVADMRHEHKFVQPLCSTLGLRDLYAIVLMTISPKHNFSTPAFMWLEGSAALSPYYIKAPISLMLQIDAGLNWLRRKWK